MTREELIRILDFVDKNREISESLTCLATTDPRWNIISYAMRRHFEGKLATVTSAASAANVPYGTAMRRISDLIDEEMLYKRARSKTGKSFSLHPSKKLISEFETFAAELKSMVGETFGFSQGVDGEDDFYFGGHYMASRILPYPNAMRVGIGYESPFKILCSQDPTFQTLNTAKQTLDDLCGGDVEIILKPLDALHDELLRNAKRSHSHYDLVAFDLPWLGELVEKSAIQSLDTVEAFRGYSTADFHRAARSGSIWAHQQMGLPIQPTVELLFCREDWFLEAGLSLPETTDDLLCAARALHKSGFNRSGIVMNYGRGLPVAHSFVQTLADFGRPIINLNKLGDEYDIADIEPENMRPMLNTPEASAAASFMVELNAYAHQDSLNVDWDKRIALFSEGKAAMTYGWSVRAARFERDSRVEAHGNVVSVPHPNGPSAAKVSPIGGFSLAIPSGVHGERKERAWKVLEFLTRPEMLKWYALQGNPSSPRFSTSNDPEVQASSQLIGKVDALDREGVIQSWPRPAIPELNEILLIIGDEIHAMLRTDQTQAAALSRAQNRIDGLMRARGHY